MEITPNSKYELTLCENKRDFCREVAIFSNVEANEVLELPGGNLVKFESSRFLTVLCSIKTD